MKVNRVSEIIECLYLNNLISKKYKIFCLKKRTYATKGSLFIIIFSNIHLN